LQKLSPSLGGGGSGLRQVQIAILLSNYLGIHLAVNLLQQNLDLNEKQFDFYGFILFPKLKIERFF
jgi:hypothetical protein